MRHRIETIAVIVVIMLIGLLLLQPIQSNTVPVEVHVTEPTVIGIPPMESGKILIFSCPKNGVCRRNLSLSGDKKALIKIHPEGEIGEWLEIKKNNFVLDGRGEIPIEVSVPAQADKRVYNGRLIIRYYRILW